MEILGEDQDISSMSCHPLAAFQTHSDSATTATCGLPLELMVHEALPFYVTLQLTTFHI